MLYILGIGTRAAAFQAIEIPQDLRWRAVELEIILREAGNCLQPFEIVQGEPPVFERNQFVAPESLEDAVRVHRGQTEHVGQIRLRKGQPDCVILGDADRLLPPNELAQHIATRPRAERRPSATMRSRSMAS